MNIWLVFLVLLGIILLVNIIIDILCGIVNMILDPCEAIACIKKKGGLSTLKQYIKEVWDNPLMKGWWTFNF